MNKDEKIVWRKGYVIGEYFSNLYRKRFTAEIKRESGKFCLEVMDGDEHGGGCVDLSHTFNRLKDAKEVAELFMRKG